MQTTDRPTGRLCEDCGVSLSAVCWPCFLNRAGGAVEPEAPRTWQEIERNPAGVGYASEPDGLPLDKALNCCGSTEGHRPDCITVNDGREETRPLMTMPRTRAGRYIIEEWENEGGPDPEMVAAIIRVENEAIELAANTGPARAVGDTFDPGPIEVVERRETDGRIR